MRPQNPAAVELHRRPTRKGGSKHFPTPKDWLVVGLGNPGSKFAATRHNAGASAVFLLSRRNEARFRRSRSAALTCEVRIAGKRVVLAFPQTYMNRSGESVVKLLRRYELESLQRLVVLHDELDLLPGVIRVKSGGGLAGHKGLASLRDHLRSADFTRVRIGIGKPPNPAAGALYVLRSAPKAELAALARGVDLAADAVECIVSEGAEAAMNRFNSL